MTPRRVLRSRAPGRVNLIGDHTDYNEGRALPMAIDLATTVELTETESHHLLLRSDAVPAPAVVPIDVPPDPGAIAASWPAWARLAAAVVSQARPERGGLVRIASTVPVGAGLSSSAAFCVAIAMALGVDVPPVTMAVLAQRAESLAGTEVGLMDPLVSAAGRKGCALAIDFATLGTETVPMPPGAEVVVVHSGEARQVGASPYAARRAECAAAAALLGSPLGRGEMADLPGIADPVLRRRARHVITECDRVAGFCRALAAGDLQGAGQLMAESHRSLAGDFEASTPVLDALVAEVSATGGVYGARVTGAGFGGCVVALGEPGALDTARWPGRAWRVEPSDGASVVVTIG